MTCPICKKPVTPAFEDFPFCSERCRLIDLGNWAMEKYVVPEPIDPDDPILETLGERSDPEAPGNHE